MVGRRVSRHMEVGCSIVGEDDGEIGEKASVGLTIGCKSLKMGNWVEAGL